MGAEPLWTCPRCGHRFVSRNLWHSCGRYSLEAHFERSEPGVQATFDRLVALAQRCGPVTIYAQKTRIVFMVQVRFAGVVTRRRWLNLSLWLTRPVKHDRLTRTEQFGPRSYGLTFRLAGPGAFDDELAALFREAYRVGCREHLIRG